nr:MAG TPA: hypothetical protein [Bacteriophage sp.]
MISARVIAIEKSLHFVCCLIIVRDIGGHLTFPLCSSS